MGTFGSSEYKDTLPTDILTVPEPATEVFSNVEYLDTEQGDSSIPEPRSAMLSTGSAKTVRVSTVRDTNIKMTDLSRNESSIDPLPVWFIV